MDVQNVRTYLIGIFAIIASWMIATWQTLIEKISLNALQLLLILSIQGFVLFFIVNLLIKPKQLERMGETYDELSNFTINNALVLSLFLYLTFLSSSFATQIAGDFGVIFSTCNIIIYFISFSKKKYKFLNRILSAISILLMLTIFAIYVFSGGFSGKS